MTTWIEALRIVLMESVIHLLDVLHGLAREPKIPENALRETALLLADPHHACLAETIKILERVGVVMGELYFVDPDPLPGQEGAERGGPP